MLMTLEISLFKKIYDNNEYKLQSTVQIRNYESNTVNKTFQPEYITSVLWRNNAKKMFINAAKQLQSDGGVAQMVERSLSMREVPGSMPGTSIYILKYFY